MTDDSVTPEDLIARYPEFADVYRARIRMAIDDAALEISSRVWSKLYSRGVLALAAHLLYVGGALGEDKNHGEPLQSATSMSAGGLSVGLTDPASAFKADEQQLARSTFGQEYLRLKKLTGRYVLAVR